MSHMRTEPRLRLYLVTGVMINGISTEVSGTAVLAFSEDEANGIHIRYMQGQFPRGTLHSCKANPMPDELVLAAAKEILT